MYFARVPMFVIVFFMKKKLFSGKLIFCVFGRKEDTSALESGKISVFGEKKSSVFVPVQKQTFFVFEKSCFCVFALVCTFN